MESKSALAPNHHKPATTSPVMDVVAQPPEESSGSSSAIDPLDKLVAEDKAEQQTTAKKAETKAASKPTKPKPTGSSISLAITATVIIVLGLATLATYAYLQTAK